MCGFDKLIDSSRSVCLVETAICFYTNLRAENLRCWDSPRSLETIFEKSAACHSTVMHFLASHLSCDFLCMSSIVARENTSAIRAANGSLDGHNSLAQQFLAYLLSVRWNTIAYGRAGNMRG